MWDMAARAWICLIVGSGEITTLRCGWLCGVMSGVEVSSACGGLSSMSTNGRWSSWLVSDSDKSPSLLVDVM